jgi:hypothetical protein
MNFFWFGDQVIKPFWNRWYGPLPGMVFSSVNGLPSWLFGPDGFLN